VRCGAHLIRLNAMTITNVIMRLVQRVVICSIAFVMSGLAYADDTSNQPVPVAKDITPTVAWILPKIYGNVKSRYSIKYPDDWKVDRTNMGIVVIQGKENTPSYHSAVNIQAIHTKEFGGRFESVKEFIYSIKYQVAKQFPGSKVIGDGDIILTQSDGNKAHGKYVIFTFNRNGMLMEQWQIVVQRNDGKVFYTWAYTSPYVQYHRDLQAAKMMLDTWHIY
jgi:hypothetical protein